MQKSLLTLLFLGGLFGGPSNPELAVERWEAEKYGESLALFMDSFEDYDDQRKALEFNIAQCYLKIDSAQTAMSWYSKASNVNKLDAQLASMSWNNIGALQSQAQPAPVPGQGPGGATPGMPGMPPGGGMSPQAGGPQGTPQQADPKAQIQQALGSLKQSLKLYHDNEEARYNYELLKRKLQQMEQQQQQQEQNEDQQENKDDQEQQQDQEQKQDDKGEQKNKEESEAKQPDNQENKGQQQQNQNGNQGQNQQQQGEGQQQEMSVEQAQMLLEAMNQNEKKFLQQLQKKKQVRPRSQNGPDW